MQKNENYINNLKLYFETIKQDFNIILTSTIPTQKNLIKTLLWLNITFIATTLTILNLKSNSFFITLLTSLPFIFSTISISILLLALIKGRTKTFAHPKLEVITSLVNEPYEEIQGLLDLINSYKKAFDNNSQIVKNRANKMHTATIFTFFSGFSLFVVIIIIANLQLGGKMSEEKKQTPPTQPREISKPEVSLSTNSKIQPAYESYKHKVESSKKEEKKEGK